MLAAGTGTRLFGPEYDGAPKALLEFEGRTLLRRHVEILREAGVAELVLVIGYEAEKMEKELGSVGVGSFVRTIYNPEFRKGAMLSLRCVRDALQSGGDWLFMDADVLYHPDLIHRLVASPAPDCLLFDAELELGEDPVMICLSGGEIVEFGMQVPGRFHRTGEWPGFLKMGPATAERLADATRSYVDAGQVMLPYEPAMRQVMLSPDASFAIEDVSDLPWIEIDFPGDLERARREILPRLETP